MRSTSREAYETIKENGLLSKRRFEVYDYVFKNGPCYARQVHKALSNLGANSSSFIARFSELRDVGVFAEVGKTIDPETNMSVILWDVTKNLPKDFVKPLSELQIIKQQHKMYKNLLVEIFKQYKSIGTQYRSEFTEIEVFGSGVESCDELERCLPTSKGHWRHARF
jgi:hypothetical protein